VTDDHVTTVERPWTIRQHGLPDIDSAWR